MQRGFTLNLVVLFLLALSLITSLIKSSFYGVLAEAPLLDHQTVPNTSKDWILNILPQFHTVYVHDGRKFYFNTATSISECRIQSLPKLSSVTFLSNGKTLNTTFWLSRHPLNGTFSYYPFLNVTQIHQRLLDITITPSQNKTLDQLVSEENKNLMREKFTNLKVVESSQISLAGNSAHKLVFTGRLKPLFGNFNLTAMEILIVKDEKLYNIRYLSESPDYSNFLPSVQQTIYSFRIINGTLTDTALGTTSIKNGNDTQIQYLHTYSNPAMGIEIKYPNNWGRLIIKHNNQKSEVLFFSNIDGPYLLQSRYAISINEPSSYHEPVDFITQLLWDETVNNRTWTKIVEEESPEHKRRIIGTTDNYQSYFKKAGSYILLPLDLRTINSPSQYLMIFAMESVFIKDGHLCDLVDATNQVSAPPPNLSILSSSNSSTIGPGQVKSIEVKVKSSSNVDSFIHFTTNTKRLPVVARFSPSIIHVPPSGWATTKLTIKGNLSTIFNSSSITQTLPIFAKISFPKNVVHYGYNSTVPITSESGLNTTQTSSIALTVFNLLDYLINSWNALNTPINGAIAFVSGFIGILGGLFIKRSPNKKDTTNTSTNDKYATSIADELTKITQLKQQGKISDDELSKAKENLLKKISQGKNILSLSIADELTKITQLKQQGKISDDELSKAKENLLKKIKKL
jgi:hypothetical protein